MAISLRPLSQLDPDTVSAIVTEVVQRVQEDNPRLDLRRGVFADLLAHYHAVLDTQRRTYTNDLLNSRSLKAIEEDPTLADADVVDDILSNFRFTRKQGNATVGEITVVVSDDVTVTIGQGSVWSARGKQFVTPRVYTAKAEEALVTAETDRLLTRLSDGNWAFTITVQAIEIGSDYSVKTNTLVVPDVIPPNYVTSYAASDFNTGAFDETNSEVLARLQDGIAAKALSNRGNMSATLRELFPLVDLLAMSIIGYGDSELVRAYHSIFPIALSGRCDWYVRTSETAITETKLIEATLITKNADGTGIWQFAYGRDDAPGVYEFRNIRPDSSEPSLGGYTVVSDTRGFDVTGAGWFPDIINATEAAYSAYATAVVQFTDTRDHAAYDVGDVQNYHVSAVGMPHVAAIQAAVGSRDVRPYGGDVLVKAAVPAFVSIFFNVYKMTGQRSPDTAAIQNAVAKTINTTSFTGTLYASTIQDTIHSYLTDGQMVSAIDMHARLRYPDGTIFYLRNWEVLEVPNDPANMITARTVQFLCDPGDVGITVVTRLPANL